MKFKTTRKEIMENYAHVIKTGYCEIQHLLGYSHPIAYNTGRNGWNCDVYDCSKKYRGIAITTGYSPFGDIDSSYDLCRKYDKKAQEILYSKFPNTTGNKGEKMENLVDNFIEECLEENKEG